MFTDKAGLLTNKALYIYIYVEQEAKVPRGDDPVEICADWDQDV